MNKQFKKIATDFLDDRYDIMKSLETGMNNGTYQDKNYSQYYVNKAYYDGAIRMIEMLGGDWKRNEDGHHKIFGI